MSESSCAPARRVPVKCCSNEVFSLAHEAEEVLRDFSSAVWSNRPLPDSRVMCAGRHAPKPFGELSSTVAGLTSCFQEWKPEQLSGFLYSMEIAAWIVWTNCPEQSLSSGQHLDAPLT